MGFEHLLAICNWLCLAHYSVVGIVTFSRTTLVASVPSCSLVSNRRDQNFASLKVGGSNVRSQVHLLRTCTWWLLPLTKTHNIAVHSISTAASFQVRSVMVEGALSGVWLAAARELEV